MIDTADLAVLRRMLSSVGEPLVGLRGFTLGGPPHPKMRPRVNRKTGNMFVPKEERAAVKATRSVLGEAWIRREDHARLVLAALFVRPTHQRVDLDNLVKFLLDCSNGLLWRDDSQIVALSARIIVDVRRPRTAFAFASIR